MTILQGPVSTAAHGGKTLPLFSVLSIAIGTLALFSVWAKYLNAQEKTKTTLGTLLAITAICILFIVTGVWELLN